MRATTTPEEPKPDLPWSPPFPSGAWEGYFVQSTGEPPAGGCRGISIGGSLRVWTRERVARIMGSMRVRTTLVPIALVVSLSSPALRAGDFIRGDLNADGRVSIVDVVLLVRLVVDGLPVPACPAASDADADESVSFGDAIRILADAVFTLEWLFGGRPDAPCPDANDANDDGSIDISDPIHSLGCLFLGTTCPPSPFPECGYDPTDDTLPCDILGVHCL